jgi:hypothetical protein
MLPYEYTTKIWEEEEVHQNARTYDEVTSKRHGNPKGKMFYEEAAREVAKKEEDKMKLRDLIPSLSQLIQDLPRRRKKHQ